MDNFIASRDFPSAEIAQEDDGLMGGERDKIIQNKKKVAIGVIITFVVALTIGLSVKSKGSGNICSTKKCLEVSKQILANMNSSVNPCDDFYEYACGNYASNKKLREDRASLGTFEMLDDLMVSRLTSLLTSKSNIDPPAIKYTKSFFQKCRYTGKQFVTDVSNLLLDGLEHQGLEPLKQHLSEFGGWPIAGIVKETMNFTDSSLIYDVMANLMATGNSAVLTMGVKPSPFHSTVYNMTVDQPSFSLNREILLDYSSHVLNAYKDFITSAVKLFGAAGDDLEEQVGEIISLDVKLAQISMSEKERLYRNSYQSPVTLFQLSHEASGINWELLLERLGEHMDIDLSLPSGSTFVVNMNYIRKLSQVFPDLLNKTDEYRMLRNYLGWKFVESTGFMTTEAFRQLEFQFQKVLTGIKKQISMEERCIKFLSSTIPMVVGRVYVRYYDGWNKTVITDLVTKIKEHFIEQISTKKWLTPKEVQIAQSKIKNLRINLGFPDWILKDQLFNKAFEFGEIGKEAFETAVNIMRVTASKSFAKINETIDPANYWPIGPTSARAAYEYSQNSLTIPTSLLQYFTPEKVPYSVGHGSIGALIAHEIGHSLDANGVLINEKGELNFWLNLHDFTIEIDCYDHQYNSRKETLNENIADNTGLKLVTLAFEDEPSDKQLSNLPGFSKEQVFFLSYANNWCSAARQEYLANIAQFDIHSLPKARVNIPLSNTLSFGEAFKCKQGSKMRPLVNCIVW